MGKRSVGFYQITGDDSVDAATFKNIAKDAALSAQIVVNEADGFHLVGSFNTNDEKSMAAIDDILAEHQAEHVIELAYSQGEITDEEYDEWKASKAGFRNEGGKSNG